MRILLAVALAVWVAGTYGAAADVQALLAEGKLQAALAQVEDDLARNKSDVTLQFLKGLVLTRLNRLDHAAEVFQRITEEHPELPEPYNNLAVVHAARGDFEAAQQALQKAINTHPSYATAHENLGDIYAKMASQAYNHALQLDEANASAKAKLALISDLFPAPQPRATAAGNAAPAPTAPAAAAMADRGAATPAPAGRQPEPPAPVPTPQATPEEEAVSAQSAAGAPSAPASVPAVEPAPEVAPEEAPAPAAVTVVSAQADLRNTVEAWANAWSARDADAYIDAYGSEFVPADGTARDRWEQTRRVRLSESSFIKVSLSRIKIVEHGPEHAQVSFNQRYESDSFSDSVRKTLIMKKSGTDWKIVEETVR